MKTGDRVVALGDSWICAGSEGVINSANISSVSVVVKWDKILDRRHSPGTRLSHMVHNLRLMNPGDIDPNFEFLRKKGGKR